LPLLKRDLRDVLFPEAGGEEAATEILRNTQFTQPALFAIGYSLAQVWLTWGVQPTALMGHSIGEFAAACTAGVFSLEDGLKMIAERGQAMQALPGGSMMSVRLPGAEVEPLLWGDMAIGSYNGPSLCVVAGPDDQVAELQAKLEAKEVVCRHLHTSHAFHSPMMNEIVDPFAKFVSQFELCAPEIPILSTVTGDWMTDEQATDPQYWAEHLRKPVQFSAAVERMWSDEDGDPDRILIELGPRRTLATLSKQHATDPKNQISIPTLSNTSDDNAEWSSMLSAVAQLWLAGAEIDWSLLSGDGQPRTRRHSTLPTYALTSNPFPPVATCAISAAPQPTQQIAAQPETISMSRIPNIVSSIHSVFENCSGFELSEFDGDTTFFEMGLDSLVLTQTATALKKEMETEVTFRQLLEETPTVDSLAEWLDGNLPADKFAAVPVAAEPTPAPVAVAPAPAAPAPAVQAAPAAPVAAAPAPTVQPAAIAPIPVPQAVQPSLPVVGGDVAQTIVQEQLRLMAAQLNLLSGSPAAIPNAVQTPAVQQAPAAIAPQAQPTACAAAPAAEVVAPTPSTPAPAKTAEPAEKKAKRFATVKLNETELTADQQAYLDETIRMNCAMMPNSKAEHERDDSSDRD